MLIVVGMVEGNRTRGRSHNRWSDQVIALNGLSVSTALRKAEHREKWEQLIRHY